MNLSESEINNLKDSSTGIDSKENEYDLIRLFCDKNKENDVESYLKRKWYEMQTEDLPQKDLTNILYKLHYNINLSRGISASENSTVLIFRWISRVAAMFLLVFSVYSGILYYKGQNSSDISAFEIAAPAFTRIRFTLPDGTSGWLNSKSRIGYASNFSKERIINLNGEAFFDIYSEKNNPFIVNAGNLAITAVGTIFNVAAYDDEDHMEIALAEGGLMVENTNTHEKIQVVPDKLITYNKKSENFKSEMVQTNKYTSWTEGKLVFRDDPIDVIARRLGRWYNVDIEIEGRNSDQLSLRATFKDENLEQVLYFLKKSLPIDYKIIEGGIHDDDIYSKKKVIITLK